MKYLIVKPSSLGDILHAFPAVTALCRASNARADWMIHPSFAPLMDYLPCVDRRILFERNKLGSMHDFLPAFRSLLKELRREPYDAVIDLQGLFRSSLLGSFARAPLHAGPFRPKEGISSFFYGKKLVWPDPVLHAVEKNNAMIASFLGRDDLDFHYECPIRPERRQSLLQLLAETAPGLPEDYENNRIIALAPGARWESKQWEPEFFAAMLKDLLKLHENNGNNGSPLRVLLLGTKDESAAAERILHCLPENSGLRERVLPLCGQTNIGELFELLRSVRLLICNDSGPMHIAAALGRPVFALFGPTDPDLTGPYCEKKVVMQAKIDCIKCLKRYCSNMRCHAWTDPAEAARLAYGLINEKGK